jgi:Rrf2 family protein
MRTSMSGIGPSLAPVRGHDATARQRPAACRHPGPAIDTVEVVISQTAEYALRAVVFLAAHSDAAHSVHEIAAATKSPEGYLSKILRALGRANLVQAQRGLHGGFALARSPREITVYDVIDAVDEIRRIHTCPLGLHGAQLCGLHRRLDDAMAAMENALRDSTIAAILEMPDPPLVE